MNQVTRNHRQIGMSTVKVKNKDDQLQLQLYTSTDYIRQAQVLNIDDLWLIIYLWKFNENIKITQLKHQFKNHKTCSVHLQMQVQLGHP